MDKGISCNFLATNWQKKTTKTKKTAMFKQRKWGEYTEFDSAALLVVLNKTFFPRSKHQNISPRGRVHQANSWLNKADATIISSQSEQTQYSNEPIRFHGKITWPTSTKRGKTQLGEVMNAIQPELNTKPIVTCTNTFSRGVSLQYSFHSFTWLCHSNNFDLGFTTLNKKTVLIGCRT